MEILESINIICELVIKEIPNAYKNVENLLDYERSEYLSLLANLKFSNENLFSHDEEQSNYDTLQQDFYKLMEDGLKFMNYCDLIEYNNTSEKIYIIISDIKTMYYKYFDDKQDLYVLLEESVEELENCYGRETELTERIRKFLNKF